MGNRRYEVQFRACLLALGPPPKSKSIHRFARSYMNWVEHQAAIQEDIPQ